MAPFRKPRRLEDALKAKKHKHQWKDWKDGAKFCTRCGMPIIPVAKATWAESSGDCNHAWERSGFSMRSNDSWGARCSRCGYIARGNNYKAWFRKYAKWDAQYRPKCLVCREPVMKEATICENCKPAEPQVEIL